MRTLQDRARKYADRIRQKDALITLVNGWNSADWFATIRFNRPISYLCARDKLRQFHARLDRILLGKHWSSSADRTQFIAVPEGREKDGSLHYHLALRSPRQPRFGWSWEKSSVELLWRSVVAAGSADVQPVQDVVGQEGIAGYMGKKAWQDEVIENYVLSAEFIGERKEQSA